MAVAHRKLVEAKDAMARPSLPSLDLQKAYLARLNARWMSLRAISVEALRNTVQQEIAALK